MHKLEWFDRNICKMIMYFSIFLELISVFSVAFSGKVFSLFSHSFWPLFWCFLCMGWWTPHWHRSMWIAEGLPSKLTFTSLLGSSSVPPQEIMDNSTRLPCGVLLTSLGECYSRRRITTELYWGDKTFLILLSILFLLPHYVCKTTSVFAYYLCILPCQNVQHLSDEQLMSDSAYGKDVVIPLWTLSCVAVLSFYIAAILFFSCHILTSVEICLFHQYYLSMLGLDFGVVWSFFCILFRVSIRNGLQKMEQVPSVVSFLSSALLRWHLVKRRHCKIQRFLF